MLSNLAIKAQIVREARLASDTDHVVWPDRTRKAGAFYPDDAHAPGALQLIANTREQQCAGQNRILRKVTRKYRMRGVDDNFKAEFDETFTVYKLLL